MKIEIKKTQTQRRLDAFGAQDLYERYHDLKSSDPYAKLREDFWSCFNRKAWVRANKKKDPNFGQFQFKVLAVVRTLLSSLIDRTNPIKITPLTDDKQKLKQERISGSFHRRFISTWTNRLTGEANGMLDLVMFGKCIDHFENSSCVYPVNVPEDRVFPDSSAGVDTEKWQYVFIEVDYTVLELQGMLNSDIPEDMKAKGFTNREYLQEIIDNPQQYSDSKTKSERDVAIHGKRSGGSNFDTIITFVYCYIKSFKGKKPVSRYIFPAKYKKPDESNEEKEDDGLEFVGETEQYCECISNVVKVRVIYPARSYWEITSFAKAIYLSSATYDKVMGMVMRSMRRRLSIFFKSDNAETRRKIEKMIDDEVSVVSSDVDLMEISGLGADIRQAIELVRQITSDADAGNAIGQQTGNNSTPKGYAITANEASIRAADESEDTAFNVRILHYYDSLLLSEIYRRAIKPIGPLSKKKFDLMKKDLSRFEITEDDFNYDNVVITPGYSNAGPKSARINNAQGVLQALLFSPATEEEARAQRSLIATFVGEDHADDYVREPGKVDPAVQKAGSENEDMDSPTLNPANVPVLPTDKHAVEFPVHAADYKYKLEVAAKLIQAAIQATNIVRSMAIMDVVSGMLVAQNIKGAHIQAHLNILLKSKQNGERFKKIIDEFENSRSFHQRLLKESQKIQQDLDKKMQTSGLNGEAERHLQAMNKIQEDHATAMNNLAAKEAVQKAQIAQEQRTNKAEAETTKKATDLAFDKAKKEVDLIAQAEKAGINNEDTTTTDSGK